MIYSLILLTGVLSSCVAAVLTIPIARGENVVTQHIAPRGTITEPLFNNMTRGSYMISVSVGTPPQNITLAIDTGSSDVWMMSKTADLCVTPALQSKYQTGGCVSVYDPTESSTFEIAAAENFHIAYADGTAATGHYITEQLIIGGATLHSQQMGYAINATLGTGLLGLGYAFSEASNNPKNGPTFVYPSILDQMVAQGVIKTKAYSLYLNDLRSATGSIIFGGMDTDKYVGNLSQLPVVASKYPNGTSVHAALAIQMTSLSMTNQTGQTTNVTSANFDHAVVLDSGTTLTYLPRTPTTELHTLLNAVDDTNSSGQVFVDCTIRNSQPAMTFNYGFGGLPGMPNFTIQVPASELILDLSSQFISTYAPKNLSFSRVCAFGVQTLGDSGPFILGDTFLRSAYVVYDLTSNVIAIAPTNFNSSKSSIVEFAVNQSSIPTVSGVTQQPSVSKTSGVPSSTGTAARKSGGVATIPAINMRLLVAAGIVGLSAVMGGVVHVT